MRDLPDYTGPQLNLESFREILDIPVSNQRQCNCIHGASNMLPVVLLHSYYAGKHTIYLSGLHTQPPTSLHTADAPTH